MKLKTLLNDIDCLMQKISQKQPFEGQYLNQIRDFFRVETTFSSNALEGNTHTLQETKVVLEDGITIGGKPLREFYEVTGHATAYDFMFDLVNKKGISESDILQCHLLFSKQIPDFVQSGEYRSIEVFISGSKKILPKPKDVPFEMKEFVKWINDITLISSNSFKDKEVMHPICFAAEAHRRFVNIHPFSDGNGRVARLIMNTLLYQERYFPVSIPLVRRADYLGLLERNEPIPFQEFIAELEYETLKDFVRFLHL